jgi:hypothetical protein
VALLASLLLFSACSAADPHRAYNAKKALAAGRNIGLDPLGFNTFESDGTKRLDANRRKALASDRTVGLDPLGANDFVSAEARHKILNRVKRLAARKGDIAVDPDGSNALR